MFPPKTVLDKFNISHAVIDDYENYQKILDGEAPWNTENKCTPSLMLASGIVNKITSKTFVEFDFIVSAGKDSKPNLDSKGRLIYDKSKRYNHFKNDYANFIGEQLQSFVDNIKEADKIVSGLGKVLLKCTPTGNKIATVTINPTEYLPISYNISGDLTGVLLSYSFSRKDIVYTLYEYSHHDEISKIYTVEYVGYINPKYGKQIEIALYKVDEWKELKSIVQYKNIEQPFFIEVSWINSKPIYYQAIKNIEQCDKLYSLALREYRAGAMTRVAAPMFFDTDCNGKPRLPDGLESDYIVASIASKDGETKSIEGIEFISPSLRDENYLRGVDVVMRIIETNITLSKGTISDPNSKAMTATEITQSMQDTLVLVGLKQQDWEKALLKLCTIYDQITQIYFKTMKKDVYELTSTWGDGIKESDEDVFKRLQWQVLQGVLDPVYLIAWERGVSQEEAYLMKPELIEVTTEPSQLDGSPTASEVQKQADEAIGMQLNGAQTQLLIAIIGQYVTNALTLGQAINIISVAIGITKDEAQKIIEGSV